jgi:hypothetical protein
LCAVSAITGPDTVPAFLLWLRVRCGGQGMATWRQEIPAGHAVFHRRAVRERFGLPEFTGQLLCTRSAWRVDVVKYALDTYASDNGSSCPAR